MSSQDARGAAKRATAIWLVCVAFMATFVATQFRATTDISAFIGNENESEALLQQIVHGELGRRMVLTIEAPSPEQAADASRALEERLRSDQRWMQRIETLSGGPELQDDEAIWRIFQPARLGYIAPTPTQAREATESTALRRAARELKRELERPMSPLITQIAPADPFLTLPSFFDELAASQTGNVVVRSGRFFTSDQRHAVIFLQTHAQAFDTYAQEPVLTGLESHFSALQSELAFATTLEMSGLQRLAVVSQKTIQADIVRISLLSTIGLSILLLTAFRSPRIAVIAFASIITGILAALLGTLAIFGRVHGITLAFGASLLGLIADYVVHLYCHHIYAGEDEGPRDTLRHIWPALRVAAATALVGFVLLGSTSFPGLREVAIFAIIGLVAALLTLRFVAYHWLPYAIPAVAWRDRLGERSVGLLRAVQRRPRVMAGIWIATLSLCALGLVQARWSDDLVAIDELAPELMAEETRVRERVSRLDQTRFIVAGGDDNEAALRVSDAVNDALREAPYLESYRTVSSLLPSVQRQQAVAEAFRNSPGLRERFESAFAEEGFRPGVFGPFFEALNSPSESFVTYEALADSPMEELVSFFRVETQEGVLFLTFLSGVSDPQALASTVDAIPGATLVDQSQMMSAVSSGNTGRTIGLLIAGIALVFGILFWRYRSALRAAAVLAPSILAVALTWSVLSLLGYALDLLVLAASLMIISLGVDYGVVLHDSDAAEGRRIYGAMLGVVMAAMTTLLGFGLLALSSYPLLHRIGMTAALGICAAMILAPLALAATRRSEESR